jgi:hypothetical protein
LIPVRPQLLDERGVGDHPPSGSFLDKLIMSGVPAGQA